MSNGKTPVTSRKRIYITEKMAKALELRKEGKSLAEIATELGYKSKQAVHEALKSALDRTLRLPADEVRELDLQRLDALLAGVWAKAIAGDLQAINAVLRIMERRAKLLGLDAPIQYNHLIRAEAERLAGILGVPAEEIIAQSAIMVDLGTFSAN